MRANRRLALKFILYRLFLLKRYLLIALYPRYSAKKWAARTTLDSFGFLHPENDSTSKLFAEFLDKYNFETVFEIGGNCGGRLFPLAAKYPDKQFYCSDLNDKALQVGQQEAAKRLISNIEYLHFDAQNRVDLNNCKEIKNSDIDGLDELEESAGVLEGSLAEEEDDLNDFNTLKKKTELKKLT